MDNLTQKSILLALSQNFGKAQKSRSNLSALKKVMPFLALDKVALKQRVASYSQANRLNDLEWEEPRLTGFNKVSHHHSNITHSSVHYDGPEQAGASLSPEKHESSLVSGALAYQPLLAQALPEKNSGTTEININNTNRLALQFSGILSTRLHCRQPPVQAKLPEKPELSSLPGKGLSWSIPMTRNEEGFISSGSGPIAGLQIIEPGNDVSSDKNLLKKGSESAFLSAVGMPDKEFQQVIADRMQQSNRKNPGFQSSSDLVERIVYSNVGSGLPDTAREQLMPSSNSNFGIPMTLPNRKHQYPLPVLQADSSGTLSKSFTKKVEHLVSEKVQKLVPVRNSDKAIIDEVKRELRERLKPETIVSEQMIRIVMAKLQRSMREERFRLGLMS